MLKILPILLVVVVSLGYGSYFVHTNWKPKYSDINVDLLSSNLPDSIHTFELSSDKQSVLHVSNKNKAGVINLNTNKHTELSIEIPQESTMSVTADIYNNFWIFASDTLYKVSSDGKEIRTQIQKASALPIFDSGIKLIKFKENFKKSDFKYYVYVVENSKGDIEAYQVDKLGLVAYEDIALINYDFLVERGGLFMVDDKENLSIEKRTSSALRKFVTKKEEFEYVLSYKDRSYVLRELTLTSSRFILDFKKRIIWLQDGKLYTL